MSEDETSSPEGYEELLDAVGQLVGAARASGAFPGTEGLRKLQAQAYVKVCDVAQKHLLRPEGEQDVADGLRVDCPACGAESVQEVGPRDSSVVYVCAVCDAEVQADVEVRVVRWESPVQRLMVRMGMRPAPMMTNTERMTRARLLLEYTGLVMRTEAAWVGTSGH